MRGIELKQAPRAGNWYPLLARLMVAGCFFAAGFDPLRAEPALYRNGELTIGEGLVIEASGDRYYRNIVLQQQSGGTFRLAAAEPRNLVQLDEVELHVSYAYPRKVELTVYGYKSVPCVELEPVAVARSGNTFHVLIAQTPLDPLALCAQALQPFELDIPLDAADLLPGNYRVLINNEPMDFILEAL